jgi:thioesterase domain-containing protein
MGEAVDEGLAARAAGAFPRAAVYSIYGSTEASSVLVTDLHRAPTGEAPPLGTAIAPSIRPLILNDELEPVEAGGTGRLFVGGPALFSGYFGDAELTDRVMVAPPGQGVQVYDTRDRVRLAADGSIHYVGRVDHVVKIRGFRVDLQEVETVMRRHPGVENVGLVVRDPERGHSALAGFVSPADVDPGALRTFLGRNLPPHMVPSSLVTLDSLPVTPSGKVDRVRLAELENADPGVSESGWASPLEHAVARAWAAILGHGRFDREQSFFEVGGTSLTVFSLLVELREALGSAAGGIGVETIYRCPTVASLAARLVDGEEAGAAAGGSTRGVAVRLRGGDPSMPRLFLVGSAGGTLGAYGRVVEALETSRAIIGLRDPFLWGGRDPLDGFDAWVDVYLEAIRSEQAAGPYFVCAYSSAGAFGYEIVRRLEEDGCPVGVLILVDPLAIGFAASDFARRVFEATWARPDRRLAVRVGGWAGNAIAALRPAASETVRAGRSTADLLEESEKARFDPGHLANIAALIELNSGLPTALSAGAAESAEGGDAWSAFLDATLAAMPDVAMLERLVVQYALQVRTQHEYSLQPLSSPVLLVEPRTPYAGLLSLLLRRYVRNLDAHVLPVGTPSAREVEITRRFEPLGAHFRSMRDQTFSTGLAALIAKALDREGRSDRRP